MPHVSRKKLKKKVFVKIGEQLADRICKTSSPAEIRWFLNEILTRTEQIMLAKRLAIILMLRKRYSFRTIQKTLKVTPQTVLRFWRKTKKPSFQVIVNKISEDKGWGNFLEWLEAFLLVGMPPRSGPGRWKAMERAGRIKY
ncbi:hypothetical protein A2926_00840 [Candidatus Giovannonibacteria bacterium RIFCSPLOWO2_01_FULL_44_40]|uniref:Uncharacterized protein n=1 Tax=Candidatus Giovannonibacteria bacterium RIFCSPHIGHO2_01_FULL_45_23 TaxID=1798325 RepID=A0A1F5VJ57_9BACT|nr:MAG: hypothetical protein A2834_01240 [Candidatus Giovannonibacteria bacterium RIFCSPHIGHO2_01_FULL_45_23]OGF75639.1 MAG: hypothetical protein A3C77_03340 [Candidatus Giovannonibacteria bacterium RIFCSPHIGHO2_02_FULL_45_13]OGF80063.1 MAG: hypothetical protein A2926_00840 [Candidatus Giovannonibacteria bacterium RIFCSPLOWO2_01_FULL_44_40]